MNLDSFITTLSRIRDSRRNYGEEQLEVVIPVSGMSGSNTKVKGVSAGFDWYQGKVLVNPEQALSTISPQLHTFYRQQYLFKISNLRKLTSESLKTAVYKKETRTFERSHEAQFWLWEKLREDEKEGRLPL